VCIQCKLGFSVNSEDKTKCDFIPVPTSSGQVCPEGGFSDGVDCAPCSGCKTCSGATSNDCVTCESGSFMFDGNCVSANENGVCQGTAGLVANNNKGECDGELPYQCYCSDSYLIFLSLSVEMYFVQDPRVQCCFNV